MSDGEQMHLGPDEERAREAVRSLPRVAADPDFRERLKADFVSGRLGEAEPPLPAPPPRRRRRRMGMWGLLVPSAVAVAVVAVLLLNGGPAPELADVVGDGTVTVGGRTYPTSDRDAIAGAIRAGAMVEVSDGVQLDLVYGNTFAVQLISGAATVPAAPARWFGRTAGSRVESGELGVLTGPGFRGAQMVIATNDGVIEITGTLVSVFKDSSVTCVCVHEGTASVGVDAADMEPIPAGKRKVMFADGGAPMVTDIAPPHRDHLVEFEKKYGSKIRGKR
jgi:ferric-dicitrate binding protein FerR (iron transport regulator)